MNIMNDKMNKTSICSVVALEIIGYSKKTDAEQVEIKNQLDDLINLAVIDIPQSDRVILDTGQGAVIACSGPLEDALEDALFISITIRDEILKNNIQSLKPLYVQFGINLGSVRVANSKKGQPDIIGEGVDEARRIMSFANPNQILVSRVYHEMASKLTQETSKMFEQYDMHTHEQEIYAVRLLKDQATINESADDSAPKKWQLIASQINWKYAATGLLVFAVILILGKQVLTPTEPTITMDPPVVAAPSIKPETKPAAEPAKVAEPNQIAEPSKSDETGQPAKTAQDEPKKAKVAKKEATQKLVVEAKAPASNAEKPAASNTAKPTASATESHPPTSVVAKPVASKTEKNAAHEKSSWQAFKDSVTNGSERKCTQAEIAMNQCVK